MTTNETPAIEPTWLVLHPELPDEARSYLLGRADEPSSNIRCIELEPAEQARLQPLAVLEQLSRLARMRGPSLVLCPSPGLEEKAHFARAGVAASLVESVPNGWRIVANPELCPAPLLPPDLNGPLGPLRLPDEAYAASIRKSGRGTSTSWTSEPTKDAEHLRNADAAFRVPSFPLFDVLERRLPRIAKHRFLLGAETHDASGRPTAMEVMLFPALLGADDRTVVWTHEGAVYGVGAQLAEVRAIVEPHHPVEVPACFEAWRRAVERWNPYRALGSKLPCAERPCGDSDHGQPAQRYVELVGEIRERCGIDIERTSDLWSAHAKTYGANPSDGRASLESTACDEARAMIRAWIERGFEGLSDGAGILFELDLVTRGPLIELPRGPNQVCRVLANLGAGHLAMVTAVHYPAEAPQALRWIHHALDGGDVRLHVSNPRDRVQLEGTALPAIKRRAVAALAAAYDDDD